MHAAEQILAVPDLALDERNVMLAGQVVDVAVDAELAEAGRHFRAGFADNMLIVAAAVVLKGLDGDDLEAPLLRLFKQLGGAHHRAVIAHDLAAQTALFQPGQTAQVNGRLSVAVAGQYAAAARDQRENVSRTAQFLRLGVDIRAFSAGKAAFLGRNAGRGVHMVDGDRERGVVVVGVYLDHLLEAETERDLLAHRRADEALGVGRHEVDVLGRGELRRADEVALVLAVRVVDCDDQVSCAKLFKCFFDCAVFLFHQSCPPA